VVTIKDIARSVGVSPPTVARALNDSPLISEATKARVRAAARDLGYVAHSAARVMRGEASTVIGLIVPDIENDFYATLARAAAETCQESGFQLVLSITEDDPAVEHDHLYALVAARAAGVVLVPTMSPTRDSFTLLQRLPSVQLIRHTEALASDHFGIDDERAIREAVEHLVALGHRCIAYIGGAEGLSTGAGRARGFRTALTAAGIAPLSELTALGQPRARFARDAFRAMHAAHRPTAVISGGSRVTVGILQTIAELGLSMPGDISFIAFGDNALYQSWSPPLTAIALPVREMGLACAASLIRRIKAQSKHAEPDEESGPQGALYLPRLQIRKSTSAPGGAESRPPGRPKT
jgi:LacI family transcriptional regulator